MVSAVTDPRPWHMDRNVTLGLIFAVLMQTAGAVWWASAMNAKVDQQAAILAEQGARLRTVEQSAQAQQIAGATVSAQIGAMRETLDQVRQDQRETNALLRQYIDGRK